MSLTAFIPAASIGFANRNRSRPRTDAQAVPHARENGGDDGSAPRNAGADVLTTIGQPGAEEDGIGSTLATLLFPK
jgi:hypothetical protein